jgi:quinol monooxygenase YgiN
LSKTQLNEGNSLTMSHPANVVSIHPYFKVHAGKMEEFKAALAAFVERTAKESQNLYYDFTINGDIVYCREAYVGAEGLLAHLENVGALLGPLMKLADVQRVEVHGPAGELEKLKAPLEGLKPQWFTYLFGVKR